MGSLFVSRVRERLQRRPTTAASIVEPSAAAIADAAFQLLYDLARQVARQEILLTTAQLRVCSYLNSNHIKPGQIGVFNTYIASLYGNPREVYLLAELNFSAAEYSGRPRLIQLCVQTLGNAIADLNDRSLVHREIDIYEQALPVVRQLGDRNALAALLNNLGAAYTDSLSGERSNNLQQAIKYYRESLSHYTQESHPREYAIVQNNLGYIYFELSAGNDIINMRRAINCYRAALDLTLSWSPSQEPVMAQAKIPAALKAMASMDSHQHHSAGRIRPPRLVEVLPGNRMAAPDGSANVARNRLLADTNSRRAEASN